MEKPYAHRIRFSLGAPQRLPGDFGITAWHSTDMKLFLIILNFCAVLLLISCASEPQKSDSSYLHETAAPMSTSSKAEAQEVPRGLTPERFENTPFSLASGAGGDAAVSATFMGAAMLLGTVLHSESPREDLRGTCQYGDSNNLALTSPCMHVLVNLIDADKNIQASTKTNENGHFRFYIPKGKSFLLQVLDRKGRTAIINDKAGRGDVVSVLIKP